MEKMIKPLISVIVPVYNIEEYIGYCIDSIISQTYRNLEIILVDDGSTDKSGQICDMYAADDKRIKVIHKKNGGLSDARNFAINIACGELITFVDGDDFLTSTAIYSMYCAKEMSGAQIVCCLYRPVHERRHTDFDEAYDKSKVSIYSNVSALKKMLRQSEINCSACAKLYDVKLFHDIRYPKGELYEDIATTYKLLANAEAIALVRIDGYGYFVRSGSIQWSGFTKEKMSRLKFAKEQKEYLDTRFPELKMATTDLLVSACFNILFSVIDSKEFKTEKREVEEIIISNRKMLIISKGTSKKTRFGCLLSYLGFGLEYRIYQILGVRGKMIS